MLRLVSRILIMKNTPRNEQEDVLCDFLKGMIQETDEKKEIQRAVDVLNAVLYEHGFAMSMVYDHRDGSASVAG